MTLEHTFDSYAQLATIQVDITGAETATLTESDYSETSNADGTYTYTATYSETAKGSYTFTIVTAQTSAGDVATTGNQSTTVSNIGADSLVSHWTFDDPDTNSGTAVDVVGSNDGTINGATTGVSGANETYATNEAYSFDGSGDGVDFGRVGDGLEAFSVAAWVNPDSLAGDASILIRDGGAVQTDRHWALRIDDSSGTVGFLVLDTDDSKIVTRSSATISTGSWSHLVGTVGGTTATIYVDGTAEGSSSNSSYGVQPTSAQPAKAAGADPGGYVYYDGEIDDARFYDKELNSTEVSNLYNNGGI